jgi:hypothetical protein
MILTASAAICHAEPRWCSVTGTGPNDKLIYPPIAKIARVNGIVLTHVVYEPSGRVVKVEAISGPPMLSVSLAKQISGWTLKTNANGDQLCETLIIASYELNPPHGCEPAPEQEPKPIDLRTPSIIRMELSASPVPICDWGPDIAYRNPFQQFAYAVKRGFRRIFRAEQ